MSYARVLVEVQASKPLKDKIVLKGPKWELFEQAIEYDWKPWHCVECNNFGHRDGACKGQVQQGKRVIKQVWRPKKTQDKAKQPPPTDQAPV